MKGKNLDLERNYYRHLNMPVQDWLGMNGWKAALLRKTLDSCWTTTWQWASNAPLCQKRPIESWAIIRTFPVKVNDPSLLLSTDEVTASVLCPVWVLQHKKDMDILEKSRNSPPIWLRDWNIMDRLTQPGHRQLADKTVLSQFSEWWSTLVNSGHNKQNIFYLVVETPPEVNILQLQLLQGTTGIPQHKIE